MTCDDSLSLDVDIIDELSFEVIEHLKRTGEFDDIRLQMTEPILQHEDFERIQEIFVEKCKEYCHRSDLTATRQTLRKNLENSITNQKDFISKLSNHVKKQLKQQEHQVLKKFYNAKATPYLQKYINQDKEEPEQQEQLPDEQSQEQKPDVAIEQPSPQQTVRQNVEQAKVKQENPSKFNQHENEPTCQQINQVPVDMEIDEDDDEEEIERPQYSPINASNPDDIAIKASLNNPEHLDDESRQSEASRLTFSSLDSVKTTEIIDYDDTIKLSDDEEAIIVGKPKNSYVSVDQVKKELDEKSIDLFALSNKEIKSEPDSSGAEDSVGKRKRRSNTRYSDYIK